jgi:hypothetical protein
VDTFAFISSLVSALAWPCAAVILGLIFRRQLRALFTGLADRMKDLVKLKAPGTELSFSDEMFAAKAAFAETDPSDADSSPSPAEASWSESSPGHDGIEQILAELVKALPNELTLDGTGSAAASLSHLKDPETLVKQAEASPKFTVMIAWMYLTHVINLLAARLGVGDGRYADLGPDSRWTIFDRVLDKAEVVISELYARGNTGLPRNTLSIVRRLATLEGEVLEGDHVVTKLEAYDYATLALRISDILLRAYARTEAREAALDGQ